LSSKKETPPKSKPKRPTYENPNWKKQVQREARGGIKK
jgi:hypothetical protein